MFTDLVIVPGAELSVARAATACFGSGVLLLALVWERN
jgi:hypothetical protein